MKRWMIGGLTVAALAWGLLGLGRHPGRVFAAEPKGVQKAGEVDFWSSFKGLFLAPEPEYKNQTQRTTVSGVRGMDKEAKMKDQYDWKAVRAMEEFTVTEKQMFDFLKAGQVGPFFAKKGGGQ